jgi:Zn-dependent protease
VASLLFFASVLLHELGHSVLALREKVPVKSITLFFFGGVAQIGREPPTAGAEFRIAIAGPVTSLGLAALFGGLGAALADFPLISAPLTYLGRINLLLVLFNMIPGFPLDGGRVLRSALWGWRGDYVQATRWAARGGQLVAFGFIALGVLQFFFGGGLNGLWLAFIGWYLNSAAQASYQQVRLQELLSGVKTSSVELERCLAVPGDLRLDQLVDDHVLAEGQRCFFVSDTEKPQGVITLDDLRSLGGRRRAGLTAGQVMKPVLAAFTARPDDDVWSVVQRMGEEEINQVPVVDDGRVLGLLTRERLMNHLRLRAELAA